MAFWRVVWLRETPTSYLTSAVQSLKIPAGRLVRGLSVVCFYACLTFADGRKQTRKRPNACTSCYVRIRTDVNLRWRLFDGYFESTALCLLPQTLRKHHIFELLTWSLSLPYYRILSSMRNVHLTSLTMLLSINKTSRPSSLPIRHPPCR